MTEHNATPWPVGAHVVYQGKSYRFPGEITMRDETGVVVKAFGDSEGNYTGMKHIYADGVLQPYTFGEAGPFPPLVIFPDENPITKIRAYLKRYADRDGPAVAFLAKLLEAGEDMARIRQAGHPVNAEAIQRVRDHAHKNAGKAQANFSVAGVRLILDAMDAALEVGASTKR